MQKQEGKDEDISIDFSKIKNFFKKSNKSDNKESHEKHNAHHVSHNSHADNKSNDVKVESKSGESDIGFDFSNAWSFVKKHRVFFLILIPLLFSLILRMAPGNLPITDEWAQSSIDNYIQMQIQSQVRAQYPNLPDQNINSIIQSELAKVKSEQKDQLNQQIQATSQEYKNLLQDQNGLTYLLSIDPYFWERHAQNILNNGHPGDILKDGKPYDTFMYAPIGRDVPIDMGNSYIEAYLYKIFHPITGISLMAVAFYIPVLFALLAVIPAFLLGRRIAGDFGGLIAGLIIAIHPTFLGVTAAGISDTDVYNVLFPLTIMWLFVEMLDSSDIKKKLIYGGLSGFFVGLYSFLWGGWWFVFDFILGATGILIVYEIILGLMNNNSHHENKFISIIKSQKVSFLLYGILALFVSALIFSSIFLTTGKFTDAFTSPLGLTAIKDIGNWGVWPNVFTTVAEQTDINYSEMINTVGGKLLLLVSLIGLVFAFFKHFSA